MFDHVFSSLLAQAIQSTTAPVPATSMAQVLTTLGLLLVSTVPPYLLGVYLAKSIRMADYGNRLGFIFLSIGLGIMVLVASGIKDENGKPRFGLEPKFGIDLKGGVILVYEINDEETKASNEQEGEARDVTVGEVVSSLTTRLNPSGVNEIQIRPFGENQIEIVVPDVGPEEVESIKRQVANAGKLEFRILANDPERDEAMNIVRNDPLQRRDKEVRNAEGVLVGKWARVMWDEERKTKKPELSVFVPQGMFRDALTGELLTEASRMNQAQFQAYLKQREIENVDVLVVVDPNKKKWVGGDDIAQSSLGHNNLGDPIVEFIMKSGGAARMGDLTGDNTSDKNNNYYRFLTIVLDNNARSAPSINSMISSNGMITGSFTKKEVEFVVGILNAGKLPAVMSPEPISENQINPLLGLDTIQKGLMSILISVSAVLVFMLFYYRFAGAVACFALIVNSILVITFMILMKAAFTLPGIAGMVLSVGMSVDANVLIFERIREELQRGAALRMAIRNGFAKAMSTIIDSNVTTMITAVVLYVIGSEQLKGFAVTLILGILMSMYTAIFCSRVIFDIAERKRWISTLNMMDWWGKSNIDFVKLYKPMMAASAVLIAIGIAAVVARRETLFDIDFRGGTSIEMMLLEPMTEGEVRKKLESKFGPEKVDFSVTAINNVSDQKNGTIYKIDTSIPQVEVLEKTLEEIFTGASGSMLTTNKVDVVEVATSAPFGPAAEAAALRDLQNKKKASNTAEMPLDEGTTKKKTDRDSSFKTDEPKTDEPKTDEPKNDEPKTDEPKTDEPKTDEPKTDADSSVLRSDVPVDLLALAVQEEPATETKDEDAPAADPAKSSDEPKTDTVDEPKTETPTTQEPKTETPTTPPTTTPPTTEPTGTDSETNGSDVKPAPAPVALEYSEVDLTFKYPLNARTLHMSLADAIQKLQDENKLTRKVWDLETPQPSWLQLEPKGRSADWTPDSSMKFDKWTIRIASSVDDTKLIATEVKDHLEHTTVWQSASKIGGKVAGKTRNQAAWAVFVSLLGIVGYVWIRFSKLAYGVAAVIALLHDVLVTIGLIALSAYVANFLGFLLIEEFKISLTVIAAILTLIGYSLNDTIVTFDRIREVKGKSPHLTTEMINRSINETLSRTFLTAGTTLIVVLILYALGGSGIHGFAFSMLVGVVAGTYSSVFIAAPLLLWMGSGEKAKPAPTSQKPQKAKV